jgi:hypothetical protein
MGKDPLTYIVGLLVSILAIYFILSDAFAVMLPTATAITIIGINFVWIIQIAVIVGLLYALMKVVQHKGWK